MRQRHWHIFNLKELASLISPRISQAVGEKLTEVRFSNFVLWYRFYSPFYTIRPKMMFFLPSHLPSLCTWDYWSGPQWRVEGTTDHKGNHGKCVHQYRINCMFLYLNISFIYVGFFIENFLFCFVFEHEVKYDISRRKWYAFWPKIRLQIKYLITLFRCMRRFLAFRALSLDSISATITKMKHDVEAQE